MWLFHVSSSQPAKCHVGESGEVHLKNVREPLTASPLGADGSIPTRPFPSRWMQRQQEAIEFGHLLCCKISITPNVFLEGTVTLCEMLTALQYRSTNYSAVLVATVGINQYAIFVIINFSVFFFFVAACISAIMHNIGYLFCNNK